MVGNYTHNISDGLSSSSSEDLRRCRKFLFLRDLKATGPESDIFTERASKRCLLIDS